MQRGDAPLIFSFISLSTFFFIVPRFAHFLECEILNVSPSRAPGSDVEVSVSLEYPVAVGQNAAVEAPDKEILDGLADLGDDLGDV